MLQLIGASYATTLLYALSALLLLFYGLRLLDRRNGRPWCHTIETIRREPIASAIYYAARWLGACLLLGLVLSR